MREEPSKDVAMKLKVPAAVAGACIVLAVIGHGIFSHGDARASSARLAPSFHIGQSVDEAYASSSHRRTVFSPDEATMPAPERDYLSLVFHVIDQGVLLRVSAFDAFTAGKTSDPRYVAHLSTLLEFARGIHPPLRLRGYHGLVVQGLTDVRDFFKEWSKKGAQFENGTATALPSHPKVQSASSSLHQAYQTLLEAYPSEGDHNKEAFYDYHCALDFI